MLNGCTLPTLLCRELSLASIVAILITSHQVQAHDSPVHIAQGTASQDIIVNQLTAGVSSQVRHGPVRSGETLSSIAKQRMPATMSREQYMNLVFQLNPQAFINNNRNKLKVNSLLILPGYADNHAKIRNANIAKQRTTFSHQHVQLAEFDALLRLKVAPEEDIFVAQVPIRTVAQNTLNQQQKQEKLQAQIQRSVMHEQVSLLQQIDELKDQLTTSQASVTTLNNKQQQLTLKNQNLLQQIQDLHIKYDHIIHNYTFAPKF